MIANRPPPMSLETSPSALPNFFFYRRRATAFDQQVNYQTPAPELSALLRLFRIGAQVSRVPLFWDFLSTGQVVAPDSVSILRQLLARVTLNCDQINLHLHYVAACV